MTISHSMGTKGK